jgi:type I restriction enzyme, S subunit
VYDGSIDLGNLRRISVVVSQQYARTQLRGGELVISLVGYPGECAIVPLSLKGANIARQVALVRFSEDVDFEPNFICQFLRYEGGKRLLLKEAFGSAQQVINLKDVNKLQLPLPSRKDEQRAIAQALSDVDALLATLDQVIAKKRDLKQAAMLQLLTGETRLPGFSGDWDVKRLGQVLTICHGKSQRDVEIIDGAYPILATGGQIGTALRPLYDKPSVLIGRKGTINQPQYMDEPFWTVDTLFYSVIKDENSAKFLYYRFCWIDWMQYNEASGVPSLNARTIESIEIACPEPAEQAAIADVLSDMDAELIALESRRDKAYNIKQAMMQELLTGKTRLV